MAHMDPKQSERKKDNGAIVFGSRVSLAWDTSTILSRCPFRPMRKQQPPTAPQAPRIHMKACVHGVSTHAQFSKILLLCAVT